MSETPSVGVCAACNGPVTAEAMHADGVTYSCPCGRTRMTYLTEGRLSAVPDRPADAPDYDAGEVGDYQP